MVTVFHYTPVNAKQFDGLNIDGLAGKHQKRQNFVLYSIAKLLCGKTFAFRMKTVICGITFVVACL